MNFWHMQMFPSDVPSFSEHIPRILQHHKFVGLGNWEEKANQILSFCEEVSVNDIIAIKNGTKLIALVQVIGGVYQVPETDDELGWIVFRRPIRVLDWEIDGQEIPHYRGTLVRCASDDVDTTKIIKKWFDNVKRSFEQRNFPLAI